MMSIDEVFDAVSGRIFTNGGTQHRSLAQFIRRELTSCNGSAW